MVHIGLHAVLRRIAMQQSVAQIIGRTGHLDRIAFGLERAQRVEQRLEHRQIRSGADAAGVGREVEHHHGQLAVLGVFLAQTHQPLHARGQHLGALGAGEHVLCLLGLGEGAPTFTACASYAFCASTAAKHHGAGGAIELRDSDHDGVFHRQQAATGGTPLVQRLKLHRVRRQVRHIKLGQDGFCGARIVVGRSTHQGKARERDQRVHMGLAALLEELFDGRAGIKAAGESGNHMQAARLQGLDHGIVVRRVAGQQIGAQQQQAHARACAVFGAGQGFGIGANAALEFWMVDTDLGVLYDLLRPRTITQGRTWPAGVFLNQQLHHAG